MKPEAIRQTLRNIPNLPVEVKDWIVEVGLDSTGDKAVWVWIILRDDEADWSRENRYRLIELVEEAVHGMAGENPPWVYVRFRAISEHVPA